MRPTLIEVFGLKFHSYTTCLSVAFLVCTLLAVRDLQRQKPPVLVTPQGGLWALAGALFGAKVFWILQFACWQDLWHAVLFWEAGLVFYGGLIGAAVALWIYLAVHRLPLLKVADGCAAYVVLGEAITRVGCFLNGCCWGRVTDVPWAVRFPKFSHAYQAQHATGEVSLPVHPTQLYMILGLLVAFAVLQVSYRHRRFDGQNALLYLLLYGVVRFAVEFYRGDSARSVFGLTVSQAISLGLIVFSIIILLAAGSRAAAGTDDEGERTVKPGEQHD